MQDESDSQNSIHILPKKVVATAVAAEKNTFRNLKDFAEHVNSELMPSEDIEEDSDSQKRDFVLRSEKQSLGGILDSGNFYNSEQGPTQSEKELLDLDVQLPPQQRQSQTSSNFQ